VTVKTKIVEESQPAAAELATETLDGVAAYGIDGADRPLIRAFMRGVAATAPLRFNHPGLGTTATRVGDRLVVHNDIGTTKARSGKKSA
jgi:hypothetical protein